MPIHRVAVLITSFNRRELTLNSLASLFRQRGVEDIQLTVFLVDDGCTDATGDAVRARFPQVRILQGDGTLYWNGGMRLAFEAALKEAFDAYVLFNDDTLLDDDALARMVTCANTCLAAGKPAIVVGTTRSPLAGERTYGGFTTLQRGFTMRFEQVPPHPSELVACDTMNGNFTLIPAQVAAVLGNIEERFRHQFGDLDYGLRAKRAGFDVIVAPGFVGECSTNPNAGTWRDPESSVVHRWKNLVSPKGVPMKEWWLFTRRHYGWRWLHYALSPYIKTLAPSLFSTRAKRHSGP